MKKERIQAPVNSIVLNEGQIPWLPENPRQWTREDVELTKASLKRDPDFQEDNPIKLVATPDGKLLAFAGNLRTTAAKELRWKTFEAILYTPENAEDEETIRRRALLDNGSFGSWDYDRLADKWNDMPFKELGIKVWDDALGADAKQPAAQAQEDDFDETADAVETRCKTGDIWQLGDHRLMCGDSTDAAQVALLMNGEKADMVFTDPPYGYQYQSNFREKTPKMAVLKNDDRILNIMPIIAALCDGWVFLCTTWKVIGEWLTQFTASRELTNMVVWSKGGGGLGDLEHTFITDYEIILVSNGGRSITGKRLGSVWEIMRDSVNNYEHPTQKPVQLPATAIDNVSNPGDSVLDLFGGSGSTLIAAEQLKRRCFMMELDRHYCDVILARWEKLTGQTARKK